MMIGSWGRTASFASEGASIEVPEKERRHASILYFVTRVICAPDLFVEGCVACESDPTL